MRQLKKKTIALVLASVVTVVGAFGADNYKNSIMSLKFEGATSDNISMTVLTKTNYTNNLTVVKRDAHTYVLMLPDTNSKMEKSPELSGNIESVDIRTMPYTTTSNGYTKITVKTATNAALTAKPALYVPEPEQKQAIPANNMAQQAQVQQNNIPQKSTNNEFSNSNGSKTSKEPNTNNYKEKSATKNNTVSNERPVSQTPNYNTQNETSEDLSSKENTVNNNETTYDDTSGDLSGILYAILGSILMISVIVFLFIRSKNKMAEILGEQGSFDISDDDEQKQETVKKEKQQKIKATIDSLDKMYKKPVKMPVVAEIQNREEIVEDSNIIDLDDLFKEQNLSSGQSESDEESDIFDDFLNDFLADTQKEEEARALQEEADRYNEELFNKFINDDSIRFSKGDIEKIDKLLNMEISEDFMKELEKLAEIHDENNQPEIKTLDSMVADLMVSKNITFTGEDIKALDKLMSVELDSDFVKNLRTNPKRTQEMSQEILNKERKKDVSEIITMKVQDVLPNLAEELKKYKSRNFECEVKHGAVYYEDGYDVQTLSVDEMPNLGVEIKNPSEHNATRPSDDIIWPDEWNKTYDTPTISVAADLPDLSDVKKNPKKYEDKQVKKKVDEKTLQKNLEAVVFKPFYDGKESDKISEEKEIAEKAENNNIIQDFDADNGITTENTLLEEPEEQNILPLNEEKGVLIEPETIPDIPVPVRPKRERVQDEKTKNLLNTINNQKEKRNNKNEISPSMEDSIKKAQTEKPSKPNVKICILDGVMYQVIASSSFAEKIGCYLATSDEAGYSILGYIGDKIFKIKNYERIQNPTFQTRQSEKLDDGAIRYIVRIGIHKFILNVSDDSMEYVMDLC